MKKHRYCVKIINNKTYLYKWTYIKKCDRNRHCPKIYEWKCVGAQTNPRTKRLLKRMDTKDAANIEKMFLAKQNELEVFLSEKEQLLKEEPFASEYEAIMSIKNSDNRNKVFKEFNSRIKQILTKGTDDY